MAVRDVDVQILYQEVDNATADNKMCSDGLVIGADTNNDNFIVRGIY